MTVNNLPADAPPPRLCVIEKINGETEYGYNLHAEKGRGQFVGLVDSGSPAERGGLVQGDRIFAVNGHSIIGENHKKVVERIKQNPNRCEMLVISEEDSKWYAERGIEISLDLPNIQRGNEKQYRPNGSPPPNGSWYAPTFVQTTSKSTDETPVFVPPPPPIDTMTPHLLPRVCHLQKSSPLDEFGFNLHAEKNRGHFIGTVDAGGIGEHAGLLMGQRIVGVNGLLIYPNTPHKDVVSLIKKSPLSTTLLVASEDVDKWYKENGIEYSFENAEKIGNEQQKETHKREDVTQTPVLNPHSIQVNEERETTKTTLTTKTEQTQSTINSYQYKEPTPTYDAYTNAASPPSDNLLEQVFGAVKLPEVNGAHHVMMSSHTKEVSVDGLSSDDSSYHESAVDVPKYVPSYISASHDDQHRHVATQQQASPMSNGSSHGYAASSTSGYDDDDIYHLSAKEARERLRMRNRKPHLHEMSLNEKYNVISNM